MAAPRPTEPADGERFEIETTDGVYRSRVLVLGVGVAEPYTPPGPAREHAIHYADVRPAETYADRRVLIIGKQNSGFELASGLLPWARQLVLVSPSKVTLSVSSTRSATRPTMVVGTTVTERSVDPSGSSPRS